MTTNWQSLADLVPEADSFTEDLAIAGVAARLGGTEILARYRRPSLSVDESSGEPVTSADKASHHTVVGFLNRVRPKDPILSEEAMDGRYVGTGQGRLWIVDPLDGTREFIDGIGEFSVMVGLAVEGQAVLGAVYRPDPGVLYLGVVDRGAWRITDVGQAVRRLTIPKRAEGGLRLVRSRSHPDPRLDDIETLLQPHQVLICGSVGVKCVLIAEGEADLYAHPVPYLKEWDTCAPEAVLRGAGGWVMDCGGEELTYGKSQPAQPRGMLGGTPAAWKHASQLVARTR